MKEQPKSRENGFYHVKTKDRWVVAEWDDRKDWYLPGFENCFEDSGFEEIGSRVSGEPPKPDAVPYQLCPKCFGDGHLWRYNSPAIMGTSCTPTCDVCNGSKVIPMLMVEKLSGEAKTPDLWKQVAIKQEEILSRIRQMAVAWTPETSKKLSDAQQMFLEASQELPGGSVPTPSDEDESETYRLPRT
jgi:hypothetical protein